MATFQYTARDRTGQPTGGAIAARDVFEARQTLRNRDLFLTDIRQQEAKPAAAAQARAPGRRAIRLKDMVVMSRQLATLVRSGISIFEALHAVECQTQNRSLAFLLQDVRYNVLTGCSLSEAMRRHPKALNEMYVSLVAAGEAGGLLEQTLEIAADQFDREVELREKIKSATVYPILVLTALAGLVLFMLIFIIPVFEGVYAQFKVKLPATTLALVAASDVISHLWWMVLIGVVAGVVLLRRAIGTSRGRMAYDRIKLKLPLIGGLNRKVAIARFTQTFAGACRAGVPILQALAISGETSGNMVVMEAIRKVADCVKDGSTLALPFEHTGQFPPMVVKMVAAGEESGNLDSMLEEIARFYNRDIEYAVANLTRVMEPAMTLLVGAVVLFVLVALYMPIFSLTQVLKQ
jgi:type IV pilus assembly protein PilC